MVRLAALRAEEDEIRALQERLDEGPALIEASDRESLMLLDHHFHSTLGAFAHSPVLAEMVENLHHRSALFWYIPISGRKEYEVVLRQHQEILDAVAARDPDAAAAAMAAHISGLAHTTNL